MKDTKQVVEEVTEAIAEAIPGVIAQDVKNNLRGVLHSVFDRLDLVTREELEVQEAVLRRIRERVQDLAKQVAELEKNLLKNKLP